MKLVKGDTVQIMRGKNRGKSGKIIRVFPLANRISVEGINTYKKHIRPKKQGEKGEIISVVRPLDASNAMIVCGNCKKTARLGYRFEGEGKERKKVRYCKKCQSLT